LICPTAQGEIFRSSAGQPDQIESAGEIAPLEQAVSPRYATALSLMA
jgi:hypothetical protein